MEILPTDPPSSQPTQEQTSPKKTLRDSLRERVSNLWKTIAESRVIPFSARRFFTRLEGLLNETIKRIGYALQRVWPDLFRPSSPADPGKESVLYVLRRLVDGKKEPLVQVGAFYIGEQVAKDIHRASWPLFYKKNDKTVECILSNTNNATDNKTEKILKWLERCLQSEPNMKDEALSSAITNLSSILFHQSVGTDVLIKFMRPENENSETDPISVRACVTDFSNTKMHSTDSALKIEINWSFQFTPLINPQNPLGIQNFTRTVSIPWEELTVDWQNTPPTSSKITVQDQVRPFIPQTTPLS